MTTASATRYLLDTNVLIAAYRSYYAFDLCPGFWTSVQREAAAGRIFSTRRVQLELQAGKDALATWVASDLPPEFFVDDSAAAVTAEYAPMMAWAAGYGFSQAALAKFGTDADGWLVATARQGGYCLVTHEARQIGARARIMIPNVCDEFGVSYCNAFDMLRALSCSFQ